MTTDLHPCPRCGCLTIQDANCLLCEEQNDMTKPHYTEKDNDGRPKFEYLARIAAMTDEQLETECNQKIRLSAYAANNPRSDYHWHVDACWDECGRRGKREIYEKAYKAVERSL